MNKINLILLSLIMVVGGATLWQSASSTTLSKAPRESGVLGLVATATPTPSPTATPTPTPTLAPPARLDVPSIGISASVEHVGMDPQGKMDVPKANENVAWYNLGYLPGEKGSAVIAGHYDAASGAPAVFYNLSRIQLGELMHITSYDGKEYTYRVTSIVTYPFDQVPLKEIFASTDKSRLNLITCQGVFNYGASNYSHRTVVYSELVDETLSTRYIISTPVPQM